jgi:hypothetical protein
MPAGRIMSHTRMCEKKERQRQEEEELTEAL